MKLVAMGPDSDVLATTVDKSARILTSVLGNSQRSVERDEKI
jgi:hypothetical protein